MGGSSVALAAGAMLPGIVFGAQRGKDAFTFRAVTGLPSANFPSYASYVLQGGVNLATRSGVVAKNVFAGPPETMSGIPIPGLARIIHVTNVIDQGGTLQITGRIDDSSRLLAGESQTVQIQIDRSQGTARTRFLDTEVQLGLQS